MEQQPAAASGGDETAAASSSAAAAAAAADEDALVAFLEGDDDDAATTAAASSSIISRADQEEVRAAVVVRAVRNLSNSDDAHNRLRSVLREHCGTQDRFRALVFLCARSNSGSGSSNDAVHRGGGAGGAMTPLLPYFDDLECLDLACFGVRLPNDDDDDDDDTTERDGDKDEEDEEAQVLLQFFHNNREEMEAHRDKSTGTVRLPGGYQCFVAPPCSKELDDDDDDDNNNNNNNNKTETEESSRICYYLPLTDRAGVSQVLAWRSAMAWRIARAIVTILGDAALCRRVLEEPILAKLHGAIVTGGYQQPSNNTDDERASLREVTVWLEQSVSKIKNRLLHSLATSKAKKSLDDSTLCAHKLRLQCVDRIMDDSRRDPDAFRYGWDKLQGIVATARAAGGGGAQPIRYLRSMKQLDPDVVRKAARSIGSYGTRGREKPEVTQFVNSLYVYTPEDASDGGDNCKLEEDSIPFCNAMPESLDLALTLAFKVFGVTDVVIKGRTKLFLCLRLSYDMKIATVEDRSGVDPSLVVLARDYLRNFTEMKRLGLEQDQETGAWVFKELNPNMSNPYYMRLLLRAHADFGIIQCEDFVNILRELYRDRALLELANGLDGKGKRRGVRFQAETTLDLPNTVGEAAVVDTYDVFLTWKSLLRVEGVTARLGLNPHVLDLLLDEKLQLGTKLKFAIAPQILECFKTPYAQPDDTEVWEVAAHERSRTHTLDRKVKGNYRLAADSKEFALIRKQLWRDLEEFMRVKLTLRAVDSEDAMVTCWICTEQHRVGARDFWVDLSDCCSQALCVQCFDRCTRLDELPLGLFPKCPFCACQLSLRALDRFQEMSISGEMLERGKMLEWMQSHVRLDDGDGLFCPVETVAALKKSHFFSPCKSCGCAVATRRRCVAHTADLPGICSACIAERPLVVKMCPRCSTKIERIGTFNDVACTCGQHICWVCGGAVRDRDPDHYIFGYYASRCAAIKKAVPSKATGPGFKDHESPKASSNRPARTNEKCGDANLRDGGPDFKSRFPGNGPDYKDQVRNVPAARRVARPRPGGPHFKDQVRGEQELRQPHRSHLPSFKDQSGGEGSNRQQQTRLGANRLQGRLPTFKDQVRSASPEQARAPAATTTPAPPPASVAQELEEVAPAEAPPEPRNRKKVGESATTTTCSTVITATDSNPQSENEGKSAERQAQKVEEGSVQKDGSFFIRSEKEAADTD